MSEVSKISHNLTQKEVDDSITLSLGRMILRMENSRSISNYLGTQELLKNDIETPDEIIKKIKSVSLNDIKNIASEIIKTKNMVLSIIGPKYNEEEIYSLLK
jgi:predicted Zn-dependent peptidase